jgi:hypothetical protein
MARMRPAWYYERQAQEAQRRADYFRNQTPPVEDRNIESRGASTDVYYRSLIQIEGTDHLIYATSVRASTLTLVSAVQAGLLTTLGETQVANRLRGSGVTPTKIHWYKGIANPVRRTTAWQTSVAVYHQAGTHRSMPFSIATGNFDANDLKQAFEGLFGVGGTVRSNTLGAANGRAHITWETVSVSAQT